ncbi:putative sulfate/molybdate transporter [Desulfosediminicola flagellatus]|uniref:putative sulfate/molybdate transporter n=1 Tax=Desulfosediminicola flagellatus TaxID=2569541 RepID=UPI0010ABB4E5|nr:putative sulfate/molybdate transporter [Desulfosediminicola flagellatus]
MRFNRMEFAGSLGDLGTLLPITIGMIVINGLSATGTFYVIGLFYIIAGYYFRVPVSVQPMKVIGAYAIATGMTAQQVCSSTLLVSLFLTLIGLTGAITRIGSLIPKEVVRGVQLSTGILLMSQGVRFILGTSAFQQTGNVAEPFFRVQQIGMIPLGLLLGIAGFAVTALLLNSKRLPAGIAVIAMGLVAGLLFGDMSELTTIRPGLHFPELLPYGLPQISDLSVALFVLVLPQIPMTIGNAVVASADLSKDYFHDAAEKVTYKTMTLSMAIASGASFLFGGIPLCHGAGGLAAHYRFGARTSGSNLIIGCMFLALALFFGHDGIILLHLLPMSILGVLLIFAGAQLGLSILDMMNRKHMFVVLLMVTVTLTANLAWAFLIGIGCAYALRSEKTSI